MKWECVRFATCTRRHAFSKTCQVAESFEQADNVDFQSLFYVTIEYRPCGLMLVQV